MFARGVLRQRKIARGVEDAAPYGPPQSLPCVKGDSPQCGEMSRSDRGARRVSGWHGVSRDGGIGARARVDRYMGKVTIPHRLSAEPPLHKGAFCVRVGVDSISARAIWQQRKTPRANNVRPYNPHTARRRGRRPRRPGELNGLPVIYVWSVGRGLDPSLQLCGYENLAAAGWRQAAAQILFYAIYCIPQYYMLYNI